MIGKEIIMDGLSVQTVIRDGSCFFFSEVSVYCWEMKVSSHNTD